MIDMYSEYNTLRNKYKKYFFDYGVMQSYDYGNPIIVVNRPIRRYPKEITDYFEKYLSMSFHLYSMQHVRKCYFCETYILLRNNNFYNIDNKYVCINCFNDENLTTKLYDLNRNLQAEDILNIKDLDYSDELKKEAIEEVRFNVGMDSGIVDHSSDIRFYSSYFCGKKCSTIEE